MTKATAPALLRRRRRSGEPPFISLFVLVSKRPLAAPRRPRKRSDVLEGSTQGLRERKSRRGSKATVKKSSIELEKKNSCFFSSAAVAADVLNGPTSTPFCSTPRSPLLPLSVLSREFIYVLDTNERVQRTKETHLEGRGDEGKVESEKRKKKETPTLLDFTIRFLPSFPAFPPSPQPFPSFPSTNQPSK